MTKDCFISGIYLSVFFICITALFLLLYCFCCRNKKKAVNLLLVFSAVPIIVLDGFILYENIKNPKEFFEITSPNKSVTIRIDKYELLSDQIIIKEKTWLFFCNSLGSISVPSDFSIADDCTVEWISDNSVRLNIIAKEKELGYVVDISNKQVTPVY